MAEERQLRGAVDPGRVLEVPIDTGDPGPGRADEEGRGHERLGEDHRDGRERKLDPQRVEGPAQDAAPAEEEQEGQPGYSRRQDDGQVDDRLDQPGAPEPAPGQDERERQAEGDREDQAHRGRGETEGQGGQDPLRAQRTGERPIEDRPPNESHDGEAEEQAEQAGDAGERRVPQPLPTGWAGIRGSPSRAMPPGCSIG